MIAGFLSLFAGCEKPDDASPGQETVYLDPVMNFHRIDSQLATGGHFVDAAAAELAEQGVTLVIDLRDQPPAEEQQQLAEAGIRWVNVPVVWKEPKVADFKAFSRLMAANEGEHILVQCQANYRASAFTYMYRVTQQGVPEAEAREDLNAIWTPEGTWLEFIDAVMLAEKQKPGQ